MSPHAVSPPLPINAVDIDSIGRAPCSLCAVSGFHTNPTRHSTCHGTHMLALYFVPRCVWASPSATFLPRRATCTYMCTTCIASCVSIPLRTRLLRARVFSRSLHLAKLRDPTGPLNLAQAPDDRHQHQADRCSTCLSPDSRIPCHPTPLTTRNGEVFHALPANLTGDRSRAGRAFHCRSQCLQARRLRHTRRTHSRRMGLFCARTQGTGQ